MSRYFDSQGNDFFPKSVGELTHVGKLGGPFHRTFLSLSFFSEHLDRAEITSKRQVKPTGAWNPGERHSLGSSGNTRIVDWGKWQLKTSPSRDPANLQSQQLMQTCSSDLDAWTLLTSKYQAWLSVCGRLANFNRELAIKPSVLHLLAERNLILIVDVYFEEQSEPSPE